jgi:hypothetical protein
MGVGEQGTLEFQHVGTQLKIMRFRRQSEIVQLKAKVPVLFGKEVYH